MNKITCDVIQDLIPLYIEQICSEDSSQLVEEHIQSCEECRQMLEDLQKSFFSVSKSPEGVVMTEKEETEIFKKVMKKYRQKALKKVRIIAVTILIIGAVILGLRGYWHGVYVPLSYEDAIVTTYTKIGERTQNEYFWIGGEAMDMKETWEGQTLVLEGRTSHAHLKEVEADETGEYSYLRWYRITDSEMNKIVYRDHTGDHVIWEREAN